MNYKSIVISVIFILVGMNVFAKEIGQQFYGTHAFIELGKNYSFQSIIGFGYLKEDNSINFSANRIMEGYDKIRKEFDSAPSCEIIDLKSGKHVYKNIIQNTTYNYIQYLFLVGDIKECAMISAIVINSKNEYEEVKEILDAFDTVYWDENSGLNFDSALFYKPINTTGLIPAVIISNRIVYTINGSTYINSPFNLYIGKNIVRKKLDVRSEEFEKIVLFLETNNSPLINLEKKYVNIDTMNGLQLNITYIEKNCEIRKRVCYFISDTYL